MWWARTNSRWTSGATRSRQVENNGPVPRSKTRSSSRASTERRAASSPAPVWSSTGQSTGTSSRILRYGTPSSSGKTLRSAGCRATTFRSARTSASASSGPSSRTAFGSWYMAVPGWSCSRNQIRRSAGDSGRRSGSRPAPRLTRSMTGSAASTRSCGTPKSTKQAISSAPASVRRRTVSAAVRSSPIRARDAQYRS